MNTQSNELTLDLVVGDIARQVDIDVVVNAANAQLMPGGGVAGAIHRAAGPQLADACRDLAPIEPGQAVITEAFDLPNRFIVHCLGPVYGRDEPAAELLSSCYSSALNLADEHGASSIAFPAISTGAFGYPLEDAAEVAIETVSEVSQVLENIRLIRFVLFSEKNRAVFERVLAAFFSD